MNKVMAQRIFELGRMQHIVTRVLATRNHNIWTGSTSMTKCCFPVLRSFTITRTLATFGGTKAIKGNVSCGKFVQKRFYYGDMPKERPPDTKVIKDVLLYENKNFTVHRVMAIFGLAQFAFWMYLANFAYSEMRVVQQAEQTVYGEKGAPAEKRKKYSLGGLNLYLGSPAWRYGLITLCFAMGSLIMSGVWVYSRRNVHRLVLRRGGQKCTFIPFGFFGRPYRFTVPLTKMTCLHTRDTVRSNLPIKVKGRWFFYLLDKNGKFYNAKLFDFTAGMRRVIDKS